jgi:hypothetical protein
MLNTTVVLVSDHLLARFNERIGKADKPEIERLIRLSAQPTSHEALKIEQQRLMASFGLPKVYPKCVYHLERSRGIVFVLKPLDRGKYVGLTAWKLHHGKEETAFRRECDLKRRERQQAYLDILDDFQAIRRHRRRERRKRSG